MTGLDLTGPRQRLPFVRLETRALAHAPALFEVLRDERQYEFVDTVFRPSSIDSLRERIQRALGGRSPDGAERWLNWVVFDGTDRLVGYTQATVYPDGHADLAYGLAPDCWGRGLAQAAVTATIEHVIDPVIDQEQAAPPLRVLHIVAERDNHRSVRLAQRLGFSFADEAARAGQGLVASEVLLLRAVPTVQR